MIQVLIFAALTLSSVAAVRQQPATSGDGGTISGSVIDATTAAPIARATVTLTPADGFAVLSGARSMTSSFALARTATTSVTGIYRFGDLPIGAYRLYVQRIGYAPAAIEVRLGDTGTSPVSIGLVVLPVRLRAVEVRATDGASTFGDRRGAMPEDVRVAAAHARQQAFLSTDARELTTADVAESATLGGSDVLRSLQRLPGVTQYDDWSAKLWVRGNRWDHNRIYYDDLPLFDPLQALGQTSGVSADAIGGAFLHPGVRPVSLGGEGATRIDLRSRPAGGDGEWRGAAELSRFGVAGALEHELPDGSSGFTATAQHTLGEWLPLSMLRFQALGDRAISDAQATARGDVDLGGGRRIETSGVFSRDARRFNATDGGYADQDWGNAAGRVTFRAPLGPFTTSNTLGVSHFASSAARFFVQASHDTVSPPNPADVRPVTSSVDYVTLGGRVRSATASRDVSTVGYDVVAQRSSLDGPRLAIYWGDLTLRQVSRENGLVYGSLWGERREDIGERVTIETGLRADVGPVSGRAAMRPAGSVQARVMLSPRTWFSTGASRTHQYVQSIQLPFIASGQTTPAMWLTSGGDVPVMSIDNAMAGVEHWMSTGALVAANAYVRHSSGIITGDPTPGALVARPLFVSGTESARGVELSARKLTGRVTGLLAYSYGTATMDARGLSFTAPASRTHALDAASTLHIGNFSLGGAYTLTSGAPYTRTVYAPSSAPPVREAPNALRLPYYSSLDVSVDYARKIGGASLIGFAGMQNVLGRTNPTWYIASGLCNGQSQASTAPECRDQDFFDAPVKMAPTFGVRLIF